MKRFGFELFFLVAILALLPCIRAFAGKDLSPNVVRYAPEVLKATFPSPWKIAPDIEDRPWWEACRKRSSSAGKYLKDAKKLLEQGIPAPPSDEEYLLFLSPSGNRKIFEQKYFRLGSALRDSTLAACLTNDPRYVACAEKILLSFCGMRTWVLSAHDRQKTNFDGTFVTMDLGSTLTARNIAAARQLLASRLSPETKQKVDSCIKKFILDPLAATVAGKRNPEWYFGRRTNNWNAVCLNGIVGTLLLTEMDADARAEMLSWCIERSWYFLDSFAPDGYCTEGVGYWAYGYGNYLELALELYLASQSRDKSGQKNGGYLNIALRDKARLPGEYIDNIAISDGNYPAFADCSVKPGECRKHIGLRDILWDRPGKYRAIFNDPPVVSLAAALLFWQIPHQSVSSEAAALPEFSAFPDGGVFLCRPGKTGGVLSAAFKGGSNHEQHNHSDVGNYVLAVGETQVVDDAGAPVYTRQTFGPERYRNRIINSFGHSVPLIGGELQINGAKTNAKVLCTHNTPRKTVIKLDLREGYPAELQIRELTREFRYTRGEGEHFTVEDFGRFAEPQTFETAVITFGKCEKQDNGTLLLTYKGRNLAVKIDTFGAAYIVSAEPIREAIRRKGTANRISIRLTEPSAASRVRLTFRPVK